MMIRLVWTPPPGILKRPKVTLAEDYISFTGFKVPKGFSSDGVSSPAIFYPVLSPFGRAFPAALVHDYLLKTNHDWNEAAEIFYRELKCIDTLTRAESFAIYQGVKFWGYIRGYK